MESAAGWKVDSRTQIARGSWTLTAAFCISATQQHRPPPPASCPAASPPATVCTCSACSSSSAHTPGSSSSALAFSRALMGRKMSVKPAAISAPSLRAVVVANGAEQAFGQGRATQH